MVDINQLSIDDLLPKQLRKKAIEVLKVFELFAGYGSQSLALKRFNIPFESVGYCEIDKYAIQAYKALHGDHIKNYGDITKVNVDELPDMNLLTYSFPCQDISVAGKQKGLSKDSGTRSSLLWECHRIIKAKRPEYLMMENVKNLVGKQNMPDFQAWLDTLAMLGYNNYWKIVNAKHCGVPQNRERVFCVSIRQDVDDGLFRFEEPFDNGIRLKHILETDVDEKYYLSDEIVKRFVCDKKCEPNEINQLFNIIETDSFGGNPQAGRIYGVDGVAPTINTCGGGQREPKIFNQYRIRKLTPKECFRLMGLTYQEIDLIQSTGISDSQQYKLAGNSIVVYAMKFLKNLNGGE